MRPPLGGLFRSRPAERPVERKTDSTHERTSKGERTRSSTSYLDWMTKAARRHPVPWPVLEATARRTRSSIAADVSGLRARACSSCRAAAPPACQETVQYRFRRATRLSSRPDSTQGANRRVEPREPQPTDRQTGGVRRLSCLISSRWNASLSPAHSVRSKVIIASFLLRAFVALEHGLYLEYRNDIVRIDDCLTVSSVGQTERVKGGFGEGTKEGATRPFGPSSLGPFTPARSLLLFAHTPPSRPSKVRRPRLGHDEPSLHARTPRIIVGPFLSPLPLRRRQQQQPPFVRLLSPRACRLSLRRQLASLQPAAVSPRVCADRPSTSLSSLISNYINLGSPVRTSSRQPMSPRSTQPSRHRQFAACAGYAGARKPSTRSTGSPSVARPLSPCLEQTFPAAAGAQARPAGDVSPHLPLQSLEDSLKAGAAGLDASCPAAARRPRRQARPEAAFATGAATS